MNSAIWMMNALSPGPPWPDGANSSRDSEESMVMRFPGSSVTAAPVVGPRGQGAIPLPDRRAHLLGEPDQVSDVVQRQQPQSQQLVRHEQVAQVTPRVRGTGLAVAGRVERVR